MKFLLIGFIAIFGWSALASRFYVCRIKGLCNDRESSVKLGEELPYDTLKLPLTKDQETVPGNLIVYFEFDKSEFESDSLSDRYFVRSDNYLDNNSQFHLSIIGYTDAIGTEEYNQALGYRRAQTMQHYFERMGIPATKIIIESKGEKMPADDNTTNAGRANNRRTSITIKN